MFMSEQFEVLVSLLQICEVLGWECCPVNKVSEKISAYQIKLNTHQTHI